MKITVSLLTVTFLPESLGATLMVIKKNKQQQLE